MRIVRIGATVVFLSLLFAVATCSESSGIDGDAWGDVANSILDRYRANVKKIEDNCGTTQIALETRGGDKRLGAIKIHSDGITLSKGRDGSLGVVPSKGAVPDRWFYLEIIPADRIKADDALTPKISTTDNVVFLHSMIKTHNVATRIYAAASDNKMATAVLELIGFLAIEREWKN